jgi:hypothetical protein
MRRGLRADQLLQDVQLKPRQNGFRVVEMVQAEWKCLSLNLTCIYVEQSRHFAYSIVLAFVQPVRLVDQLFRLSVKWRTPVLHFTLSRSRSKPANQEPVYSAR